jgi:hypothetical protein
MKTAPTAIQWIGTLAASSVVTALLANPSVLPEPARRPAVKAVDEAARVWLLLWGESTELLDDPDADWGVGPDQRRRWQDVKWQNPLFQPSESPAPPRSIGGPRPG